MKIKELIELLKKYNQDNLIAYDIGLRKLIIHEEVLDCPLTLVSYSITQ